MSLTRGLVVVLAIAAFAPLALAKGPKKADKDAPADSSDDSDDAKDTSEDSSDDSGDSGDDSSESSDESAGDKPRTKAAKKQGAEFVKQDLSGHDLGTSKKENTFEKDRFFVDKVDTEKTAKGTLVQGSLASSTFVFTEAGGDYGMNQGTNSARFSRMFTELRLQTDFRHISGGRWDARVDARARVVNHPDDDALSADPNHVQSGFNGTNEYDLRELWIFRSGKRSDVFFGRQFVADLGAIKFDGVRVDYASSQKFTLIGFGGLYPVRGSRSITTDYLPLKTDQLASAGRLVGTGGFGAAYRTVNSYGSVGGVVLAPFAGEQPRVFATSSGYLRNGATLDLYHFALVDLIGAAGAGFTNLSAGVNYKPNQRLRLTANFNRVDVDTLSVQAQAFLNPQDTSPAGVTVLQNETYFRRLATNAARVGASAGLGPLQRYELSTQVAYRFRPGVTLTNPDGMATVTLEPTQGVDVYLSFTDRHSFKDLRLGADVSRSFAVGTVAYQRNEVLAIRGFAARELASGKGEWEAEVSYATTKDTTSGIDCATINHCFGSSVGAILSGGGNLYYRVNRDWILISSLFLSRQSLTHYVPAIPPSTTPTAAPADPAVTGVMGFFRIAYRF